jgi:glycosyltransferase involved in cell wall biosynthesis
MNVVHILSALTKGGGERVAVDLASGAADGGHQSTIVAGWPVDASWLQDSVDRRVQLKFVEQMPSARPLRYGRLARWLWSHRGWLMEQDVVHCHLSYGAVAGTLVKGMVQRMHGRRPAVVETYHAVGMPIPKLNRWIHSRLAQFRDALVLMAEDSYWFGFARQNPHLLIRVIPNGVKMRGRICDCITHEGRLSLRQKWGIPAGCRYVVGTIGMMRPDRDPARYLPVFSSLHRRFGDNLHFLMGGDGPLLPEIKRQVERAGLKDVVHLPGLVREPTEAFAVMDLYLTQNVGPTTGIAALEAIFSGVPVIALQMRKGWEQADEWIWSTSDAEALAARAAELIEDAAARDSLRTAQGRRATRDHTQEAMVRAYLTLYEEVRSRVN